MGTTKGSCIYVLLIFLFLSGTQQSVWAQLPDYEELASRVSALEKTKEDKTDTKKKFSVKVGGRVYLDSVNFDSPHTEWGTGVTSPQNVLGIREARIGVSGEGFEIFDYKAELGFEYGPSSGNVSPRLKDVYMGVKNLPVLDYVRIGHYKVESGLNYVNSSRNITAMERITPVAFFAPGRRFGGGSTYYFAHDQVRFFAGIFAARKLDDTKFSNDNDNQGVIVNTRFTMVPYLSDEGTKFLHFGGHYLYYENTNGKNQVFSYPNQAKVGGFARPSGNWYSISPTNAGEYNQGGFEVLWSNGPFSVQSEFFAGSFGQGRDMYGGYVEVRYFLTGDARTYDKKSGTLGNVKMKKNLAAKVDSGSSRHCDKGNGYYIKSFGALEAFFQWGFTDTDRIYFNDKSSSGGRTTDIVSGLNWYWNPNTRMMFEYVHSNGTHQNAFRGSENIFGTSFRFFF
jgi:phosphate-selective porin OprO/OprP